MLAIAKRLGIVTFCVVVAVSVFLPGETPVEARGPVGASYCPDTGKAFWFVHASDLHIGTSGSSDSNNLNWLVTTARNTIKPLFTVVTGDLTDSTNGNIFGYPNGPHIEEWMAYRAIVDAAGVTGQDYYDLPGNHDAYNDRYFNFYKDHAIQGALYAATGQVAWTKTVPGVGTYHFLGVNTAGNNGAAFSLTSPWGDYAGLDAVELGALSSDLAANAPAANLTLVFGHHPVSGTGDDQDTYLSYGSPEFVGYLDSYGVLGYDYGHVHDNVETFFSGNSYTGFIAPGIRYSRVDSLGKDSPYGFRVVAVDCDGVSSVFQPTGIWPVVLITAPVDRYAGGVANPLAYTVPVSSANPIRALAFDAGTLSSVQYRIDAGATWYPMTRVDAGPQWAATWNASAVPVGEHSIEVKAVGTTTRSHTIKVAVVAAANRAPVANNDGYTTVNNATLSVAARGVLSNDTDLDGDALSATLVTGPTKGSFALGANGGFTYTPQGSPTGADSFTYTATDGALTSNTATVTITLTPVSTPDTVTITQASYTRRTGTLLVKATSSGAPSAVLTVVGYSPAMTYNSKTKAYTYQRSGVANPNGTVEVKSSLLGSATRAVTTK
jgi:hypothetical protein